MNVKLLKDKYIKDLEENFLPFWEKSIDDTYGGVYTCYTNSGDKLISDRKYIWSQGRFLWVACKLLQLKEEGTIQLSDKWNDVPDQTYAFLRDHALMPNHHAVFAVERNGEKIKDQLDTSIFADCFYVLGCNAYADFKNDLKAFEHALFIYQTIKKRIVKNEFHTDPYPLPDGYRSHSIPMILINVVQGLYETAQKLNLTAQATLRQDIETFFDQILSLQDGDRIKEMDSGNPNRLLDRYLDPGHTIECAWFLIHSLSYVKLEKREKYIREIEKIVHNALTLGWDDQFGGLLRYVDKEGGRPCGDLIKTPMEELILGTWETKLWWPHSESLYTTLLLYALTNDPAWLEQYQRLATYIFNTFPNEDQTIGEWVQIRDRLGKPIDQVVALPVKDPFHIIRVYLKMIELFNGGDFLAHRSAQSETN